MCQSITEIYSLCDHYTPVAVQCREALEGRLRCIPTQGMKVLEHILCLECQQKANKRAKRLSTRIASKAKSVVDEVVEEVTKVREVKEIAREKDAKKWGDKLVERAYEIQNS